MTVEEIRSHLAYSTWASRKLVAAAEALTEEQQNRDFGVSHKSLKGTLDHIHFADRIWLTRILPSEDPAMPWPAVHDKWQEWAAALKPEDLDQSIQYKDLRGNQHSTPLAPIVMHVVNHATLHRGQAMSLLRELGVAPPPTDLIFYYREMMTK